LRTTAERDAATNGGFSKNTASLPGGTNNVMPGPANVGALNAPFGYQRDYIWEAALNAGRTVRSYGFEMVNTIGPTKDSNGNPISDPFTAGAVQAVSTFQSLLDDDRTDTYFRGIDLSYPDVWRATEWLREFNQYVANGQLPSLEMVRLGGDHMGSFSSEVAGVNTPEGEQADNDYAVGKLVDAVAHSRYASDTLIVVVEDDSQDGPDHVDSHRAPAYIVGTYVKKGAVVSSFYSLVNALRTIEDVLGTEHMNLATANARPMADVFDIRGSGRWTYDAVASTVLQSTALSDTLNNLGATYAKGPVVKPTHDVSYWANATRGLDFSDVDRLPPGVFNKILWKGLKGDKPYPVQNAAKATPVKTTRNARDEK
ncbi:MAG: alkaline phosphatase family protein, partial [Polyangiaceae bacterium]|nr:alkaline phosphatase family protein [Polyangiaceae bacterium]